MPELDTLGAVIKSAYESQSDTNAFTDIEKSKLGGLAPVAESGDYADLTGKPAVIAEGATAAEARAAIGAVSASEKAVPDGVATLDSSGVVPLEQLNVSGLAFKGGWDASTNTPELLDGSGAVGDFYKVTTAGTFNFGSGAYTFTVGDWVIFAGGTWQRIGVHEAVTSVGGKTGAVPYPTPAEIGALPDTYTPPAPSWGSVTDKPDFSATYAPKMRGSISAPIPAVFVSKSQAQSAAHNADTKIVWDTVQYDPFSIKANGTEFVVPGWATHVRVTGMVVFGGNSSGSRQAGIYINGSVAPGAGWDKGSVAGSSAESRKISTPVMPVSPGDTIAVSVIQSSGGSLGLHLGQGDQNWLQIELYTTN